MGLKYTPENIRHLGEDEIFVFGSNLEGLHAGGAARTAYEHFGAVWGQGEGVQGQSYATTYTRHIKRGLVPFTGKIDKSVYIRLY